MGIRRAGLLLFGGVLTSRLLGVMRDIVISAQFGTSSDLDVYVAAFRLPDLVFTLVSGGALGSALVPSFARALAKPDDHGNDDPFGRLHRLTFAVLGWVTTGATVIAIAGMIAAPTIIPFVGAGFSARDQSLLVDLVRVLLLQPILLGTSEVFTRYLNVRGHFAVTAFAPTVYTGAIVVAALLLGPALGVMGLAIGVVTGAVGCLGLQAGTAWMLNLRRPHAGTSLHPRADLREVLRLMVPRLIGQGAVQLSFVSTTRLASFLPSGSLAALNYGWSLMMLPLGAFAMALANAAFPTFANLAAHDDRTGLAATGRRTLATVLVLMIPAMAGCIVFGSDAIELLFGRRAFTAESVSLTTGALIAYAVGLPAHGTVEVQMRLSFALGDTRSPVAIGLAAMAIHVLLATLLVDDFGYLGIALALSIAVYFEAFGLAILLHRQLPGLHGSELIHTIGATIIATGAGALTATAGTTVLALAFDPAPGTIVRLGVGLGLFAVVTIGVARVLQIPALTDVEGLVRERVRRLRALWAPRTPIPDRV